MYGRRPPGLSKGIAQLSHLALLYPHDLDQFSLWPHASVDLSEMGTLVVLTPHGTLKLQQHASANRLGQVSVRGGYTYGVIGKLQAFT